MVMSKEDYERSGEVLARVEAMMALARGNVTLSVGEMVAKTIISLAQPKCLFPESGITWAGNWPTEAIFGATYQTHHRDFGNRASGWHDVYFESREALDAWMSDIIQGPAEMDWAYSLEIRLYEWDWGPVQLDVQHY